MGFLGRYNDGQDVLPSFVLQPAAQRLASRQGHEYEPDVLHSKYHSMIVIFLLPALIVIVLHHLSFHFGLVRPLISFMLLIAFGISF